MFLVTALLAAGELHTLRDYLEHSPIGAMLREEALQAGEQGDLNPLQNLLKALENPYEEGDLLTPYQAPPKPSEKVLQTFCGT